jgi:hypothetical protein
LNPAERAALAVQVCLEAVQDEYYIIHHRVPDSYTDLERAFPGVMTVLRNDFSGSFARTVEYASPGHLLVKHHEGKAPPELSRNERKFFVEIYGDRGHIPGVTDYGWWSGGGPQRTTTRASD